MATSSRGSDALCLRTTRSDETRYAKERWGCDVCSLGAMTTILHITADFPDALNPHKTLAVKRLIRAATWATNIVVSMNRVVTPSPAKTLELDEDGVVSMAYFGLPWGVGLSLWMQRTAERIAAMVERRGLEVDLIHAHKLTFEGLVAERLSELLGVPYCVTVRGHTDHRVVWAKPGLRRHYRRIVHGAARVFFLAPWSRARLADQLSLAPDFGGLLPNTCSPRPNPVVDAPCNGRLISPFHFRSRRVKNIAVVFDAIRMLRADGIIVGLDVVGAANAAELESMHQLATKHGVASLVEAKMAMPNEALLGALPSYAGLVLPSYPETFGLAYLEALQAGIPVIHAKNSGIDGFFQAQRIVRAVDHRDQRALAESIRQLVGNYTELRYEVRRFVAEGGLAAFSPASVDKHYRFELQSIPTAAREATCTQ